ncbi:unnamed protein product [Sphagnum jensenii]|uniref:Zinc finger PHD-type domain-containing protein n=1 Tax=Sphagnum jensenii TaxID=128206 RepID=A0ABP1AVK3_9BRYO
MYLQLSGRVQMVLIICCRANANDWLVGHLCKRGEWFHYQCVGIKLRDTIQREMVLSYMWGIATKWSIGPPLVILHYLSIYPQL